LEEGVGNWYFIGIEELGIHGIWPVSPGRKNFKNFLRAQRNTQRLKRKGVGTRRKEPFLNPDLVGRGSNQVKLPRKFGLPRG